jgi:hypothetical protein
MLLSDRKDSCAKRQQRIKKVRTLSDYVIGSARPKRGRKRQKEESSFAQPL